MPIVEKAKLLSRVRLFVTPWTVAHQDPPSMGFSRQEYWSGLPFLSPGALPDPGIRPRSPALQADALTSEPPGKLKLNIHIHYYPSNLPPGIYSRRVLIHIYQETHTIMSFFVKVPQWKYPKCSKVE